MNNDKTVSTSSANVSSNSTNINIDEDKKLRLTKKRKKWPFILILLISFIGMGIGGYFLYKSINKYNTYKVVGADLISKEKIYEAGRPYYVGKYQYVVAGEKYYYNYDKKFEGDPDSIIQIKYKPSNPNILYNSKEPIIFIAIIAGSFVLSLVMIGILLSITSKMAEKIVVTIVEDTATCVGGRKIYMRTIDPSGVELPKDKIEYFSYFTDKFEKFPIGKKVKFNAFKYSEVLSTEKYKDNIAMSVNEFNIDDFIFIN